MSLTIGIVGLPNVMMNSDAILGQASMKAVHLGVVEKPIVNDSVDRVTLCEDVLSLLGNQFADLLGGFGLGALETSEVAHQSGFAHQSDTLGVIDDLGNHVTVGTGNHQTRKLRGTADVLAYNGESIF